MKLIDILLEIKKIISGSDIIKQNQGLSKSEDGSAFISADSKYELLRIPINKIQNSLSYSWYKRNDMDEDLYNIDRLIKKIKDGISLNPIVLNKKYKIQDGNHRFIAYKTLRFKEIDVYLEI
jgi:hypothetical protein